jgi:hypothetical protein
LRFNDPVKWKEAHGIRFLYVDASGADPLQVILSERLRSAGVTSHNVEGRRQPFHLEFLQLADTAAYRFSATPISRPNHFFPQLDAIK